MAESKATKAPYSPGTGRRKRAVARVFLTKGTGKITLNDKAVEAIADRAIEPLTVADLAGKVDLSIRVAGGGMTGQIGAIRHGVARAVAAYDTDLRKAMRDAGMLTRDSREKERKKPGLKRARRAPQWAKR